MLDGNILVLFLAIFFGCLGFMRGTKAEGLTLAGVMASAIVFTTGPMRERLVTIVNKIPKVIDLFLSSDGVAGAVRGPVIRTQDQQLLFYLVIFILSLLVFYLAGNAFGGKPASKIERTVGFILGGLSGFVIGLTMVTFSQNYLGLHPEFTPPKVNLPAVQLPMLPSGSSLFQFAPVIFMAAVFAVAVLTFASLKKAKP